MTPASDLVSGEEPDSAEPTERAEEPVQADHIGAFLCATRMRTGGDLQEIAKILKIRYGYLVAIEDGRHEDLPGSAYSVGFVRAYADYLGLDGNEVVRRLREETNGTVIKARFEFPIPSTESGLPNGGLLAIAVAMGMVVYGAWYTITNADRDAVDLIQEVPGRLAVLIEDENPVQDQTVVAADIEPIISVTPELEPARELELSVEPESGPQIELTAIEPVTQGTELVESVALDASEAVAVPEEASSEGSVQESPGLEVQVADVVQEEAAVPLVEASALESNDTTDEQDTVIASITEVEPVPASVEPVDAEIEDTRIIAVTEAAIEPKPNPVVAAEEAPVSPDVEDSTGIEPDDEPTLTTETASLAVDEPVEDVDAEEAQIDSSETVEDVIEAPSTDDVGADSGEVETVLAPEENAVVTDAAPLVIELRAKSDSWIQVRDGNELLLTRLLREGEVYQVPDRDGLTLMTGNAGGLEVLVGGELMPPLGDVGVVRRGVPLSAERLRSGVAPS